MEDVAHVSVELESGWTLESAVVDGELLGFFAWIPEAEVTPGNVNLAWIEHVGGGAWAMFGWDDSTSANAVGAIENYLTDSTALDGIDTESLDSSFQTTDQCDGPGIFEGGEAMPAGATQSDPAAPILEAIAGSPNAIPIAEALANSGASVAPGLTELVLSNSPCPGVSEFDSEMSRIAIEIASDSNLVFAPSEFAAVSAMASNCGLCLPRFVHFRGPWSAWSCTTGPTAGGNASCPTCTYDGCTRSRTHRIVWIDWDCSGFVIPMPDETDGPKKIIQTTPLGTPCPPSPQ